MKTIPLTQGKFAIVDNEDFDALNKHKWCVLGKRDYVVRAMRNRENKRITVYMHRVIMGAIRRIDEVDHVNLNRLDNRRSNLRKATRFQNSCNRPKTIRNKSGHKGVRWRKDELKWEALIGVNGKLIGLGMFMDINEAAMAYQTAAKKYHGEFARW